jgi:hypothetical protein
MLQKFFTTLILLSTWIIAFLLQTTLVWGAYFFLNQHVAELPEATWFAIFWAVMTVKFASISISTMWRENEEETVRH